MIKPTNGVEFGREDLGRRVTCVDPAEYTYYPCGLIVGTSGEEGLGVRFQPDEYAAIQLTIRKDDEEFYNQPLKLLYPEAYLILSPENLWDYEDHTICGEINFALPFDPSNLVKLVYRKPIQSPLIGGVEITMVWKDVVAQGTLNENLKDYFVHYETDDITGLFWDGDIKELTNRHKAVSRLKRLFKSKKDRQYLLQLIEQDIEINAH